MYKLIGGEASPYTAKVRCFLRFKNIPFEPVQASAEIYDQFITPKVGIDMIPVLVTPQNQIIQDSDEIISTLEERHPAPSIIPRTPKQKIVSLLFELFCDEWMVVPVMHYRFSFEENKNFLSEELGRVTFPRETSANRSNAAAMVYQKLKSMLPIFGITRKTAPNREIPGYMLFKLFQFYKSTIKQDEAIEKSWKALLHDLSIHFDAYPYLLGGRPCVGDFSLAGMTCAGLFRDPIPGFLMKTTAPLVAAWAEHMNGQLPEANKQVLHHVDADGNIVRDELPPEATDFCGNDDTPETLFPILHRFFTEYAPVLLSTRKHLIEYIKENVKDSSSTKLPRNLGLHEFTIDNVTEKRGISTFCVWKWQHLTDYYQTLSTEDRTKVDKYVKNFPHGLDIVQADLNSCRVTRINNIVHADVNF